MLGIGFVYALSLGLIVAAVEANRIPEEMSGFFYVVWAFLGIGLAAYAIRQREKK
jgi:hypothetical protein